MILAILLLDLLTLQGVLRIRLQTSYDSWFLEGDPLMLATEEFKEFFGNNHYVALLVEADDVFAPDLLRMIQSLGNELLEKVPFAQDVVSLADFEFGRGTDDGLEIINIVPESVPDEPEEIEKIRRLAFSKAYLIDRLFSDDSREAWIVLRLERYPDEEQGVKPYRQAVEAVYAILRQERYASYSIKAAGRPVLQYEQRVFFPKEALRLVALALVVAAAILWVSLRSLRDVAVAFLACFSALLWSFGLLGWLDIQIDSIVVTLPIYLGLAISIGYSIHLFNFFRRRFFLTGERRNSVLYTVEHLGRPILFTAFTTFGAMLTFYVIPVPIVRWMGLACAATVLSVYLIVMILTPAMLSFGKDRQPDPGCLEQGGGKFEALFARLSDWILAHPYGILVVSALIAIACLVGVTLLYVSMDFTNSYGPKVPFVEQFNAISETKVGAYQSYDILLRFDEPGRAKSPEILRKFNTLASEVRAFPLVKRTTSLLRLIKDLNQVMQANDPQYYRIPERQEYIAQLLLLYEIAAGAEVERWIDYDYSTLRMMVEITDFDTAEIEREFRYLEERSRQLFPDGRFSIVGDAVQVSVAQNYIAKGEVKSFLAALCAIAVLMMLVFRSVKSGLIGMIPNVAPAIAIWGVMGYAGIPLDMMTMMVIPMLLGLAVDDTIHFMNHCQEEFREVGDYPIAIRNTFTSVGKSIVSG